MTTLFDPLVVGDLHLPNRVIMAPLTRSRAGDERVPNALMAEYYVQRASAGLIISEATAISPQGVGYAATPGIWSSAQVAGWRLVTDAVHRAGGRIVLQLWHVGRISHPSFLHGAAPVAPSAIAPRGNVSLIRPPTPFVVPRALTRSELPGIIADYRRGAENAQRAGFDGVELHGANGYLLDQFLQDGSNHRTDDYGGTVANRARLMLEAVDAAIAVWGPGRVGLHLAPRGDSHDIRDSNRLATFGYVAEQAKLRRLAFLCVREHDGAGRIGPQLRRIFGGAYIANERYTGASAARAVAAGDVDAVAFGKAFIANPDLPRRLREGAPLNAPDVTTFYAPGATGYTDYPALAELAQAAQR
jgi:2,4-dienoyl-CoA reductase-like NADH-dependent reductase (Old Yellow Enzyme family)